MKTQADKEFNDTSSFDTKQTLQIAGYAAGGTLMALGTALIIWEYVREPVNTDDLIPLEAK